jgi:hypothetical protein
MGLVPSRLGLGESELVVSPASERVALDVDR